MKCLFAVLLLVSCGAPMQSLDSPCKQPNPAFGCSGCDVDTDCAIISNPCNEAAICVPSAGQWAITAQACRYPHQVPPASSCGCVEGSCQAR
jgi:hypothetical protein